jgi:COMPASS component SWD3
LVAEALQDHATQVQKTAYLLLKDRRERKCQQAIAAFNPYRFFECIRTVKAGTVVAISADAKAIATKSTYGSIKVWQPLEKEEFYTLPPITGSLGIVCLNGSGDMLVRVLARVRSGVSSTIQLWQQGELVGELVGHGDTVSAIAFSPDGKTLATGSHDKSIKLWDLDGGKLICTFSKQLFPGTHGGAVISLAFSDDSRFLFSGGYDQTIKRWDIQTRGRPQSLVHRSGSVMQLLPSPNGKILAGLGWGRNIDLWQAQTGAEIRSLDGHTAAINAIAISPNDQTLVSVGNDRSIRFWHLNTGENFHTLSGSQSGHQNYIEHLAIAADGQSLITTAADKTLKLWAVPA